MWWIVLASACAPDLDPAWAIDPWWVEPAPAGGIHGFQTWMLYGKGYPRTRADRTYACSVVVEISGTPTDACPGCSAAWDVSTHVAEHDCDAPWDAEPAWTSLRAIGIGDVMSEIVTDDPHPGASSGGFGDYGGGWLPHGWVWPASVDSGGPPVVWDGVEPLLFWPAWAWDL